jgi:hypothetical protein
VLHSWLLRVLAEEGVGGWRRWCGSTSLAPSRFKMRMSDWIRGSDFKTLIVYLFPIPHLIVFYWTPFLFDSACWVGPPRSVIHTPLSYHLHPADLFF